VKVHADPALQALYPAAFPARLVLRVNGNTHELLVTDSPGDPALPYDAPQLLAKARRMLGEGPGLATVQAALRLPTDSTALPTLRATFNYA
jgi:2-methylcitrate dehydratase PrpD